MNGNLRCYICLKDAHWRGHIAGIDRPICNAPACQRRAAGLPREHCWEREQGQLCGQWAVAWIMPGKLGLCRRHLWTVPTSSQSPHSDR